MSTITNPGPFEAGPADYLRALKLVLAVSREDHLAIRQVMAEASKNIDGTGARWPEMIAVAVQFMGDVLNQAHPPRFDSLEMQEMIAGLLPDFEEAEKELRRRRTGGAAS